MSVTYEQTAKYTYSEEKFSDKAFCKVAKKLMDRGLTLVGWHYSASPPEIVYGEVEKETVATDYEITIGGKSAFTTQYRSTANDIVAELEGNGFDGGISEVTRKTTKMVWQQPKGSKMYMQVSNFEGELSYYKQYLTYSIVHPRNDGMEDDLAEVELVPKLTNSNDGVILTMKTILKLDRVLRADRVKPSMVDITLHDFGLIKSKVEDALGIRNAILKDCTFNVNTLSETECSPDIIYQREVATQSARDGPQEEE
tara:strand:+ start:437 stop:1201 length:765 start_codon:yes stop_codon:yes gene_type:complete